MKVLFLSPQSFYVDRGTPIAVRFLLHFFSRRGWQVDALVFPGGRELSIPGVRFFRTSSKSVNVPLPPGFTFRKLFQDVKLFFLARKRLREEPYDYIHAVEESAFIAALLKRRTGVPFVCDMDSSMPEQLAGKNIFWRVLRPFTRWCESLMLRSADVVLAVCEGVADRARRAAHGPVLVLPDPPVCGSVPDQPAPAVRTRLKPEHPAIVYVGNLQGYQGLPLLLKSFRMALAQIAQACLIVVGGDALEIESLARKCRRMGIEEHVQFVGARPLEETPHYLAAADILVSPRLRGENTPMKLYSYLQAGKPIVATNISSHTQVLTPETAILTPPEPQALADALVHLAKDPALRQRLGQAARHAAETQHSLEAFNAKADEFCRWMEQLVRPPDSSQAVAGRAPRSQPA